MKKISNKQMVSALSSLVVVTIIVLGIIYLFSYDNINEGFKTDTTHNVDLPLNQFGALEILAEKNVSSHPLIKSWN